jgi:protein-tyrosine phosphatase
MPESVQAAAERGVDIAGHAARRLDAQMLGEADLVVCMAAEHRDAVGSMDPGAAARTFTLKELVTVLESSGTARPGTSEDLPARVAAADDRRRDGGVAVPADEDIVDPLGAPRGRRVRAGRSRRCAADPRGRLRCGSRSGAITPGSG